MSEESNEASLRRYLLADLDEAEREKIEERLFSDDGFEAELTRAEGNLIDDYALAVLSKRERELFERNFILTDERRQNLHFALTVNTYLEQDIASPTEPERHPWHERFLLFLRAHKAWAIAATAAAVVLMVFSVPALLNWFAPNNHLVSMGIQREQMERQLAELNRQTLSSGTVPGLEVSLNPTNLLRDGGEFKQVEVIKGVRILNFTFVLPDAQQNKYIVIARKIDGDELFSVSDLSPKVNGTPNMFLRIPAEFLPPNDYQFEVKGTAADGGSTSVAIYNLRVVNPASQP